MKKQYDDIIDLPHHVSSKRPRMAQTDRAAQFSPFAALTGYDAAVRETARLTDRQIETDDTVKAELDRKLRELADRIADRPAVTVTYFRPDDRKEGGAYLTHTGKLKKIDPLEGSLTMQDGTVIPFASILKLASE